MTAWLWKGAFALAVLVDLLVAVLIVWFIVTKQAGGLYIVDRPIYIALPRLLIMLLAFLAAAAAIWEVKIR